MFAWESEALLKLSFTSGTKPYRPSRNKNNGVGRPDKGIGAVDRCTARNNLLVDRKQLTMEGASSSAEDEQRPNSLTAALNATPSPRAYSVIVWCHAQICPHQPRTIFRSRAGSYTSEIPQLSPTLEHGQSRS
ncbi:UNVERIFIED_CONTAM: hypothetical protein FKN15_078464 [Acipenser sinensis]